MNYELPEPSLEPRDEVAPEPLYTCDKCGASIYAGDDVWILDDGYTLCEGCMDSLHRIAGEGLLKRRRLHPHSSGCGCGSMSTKEVVAP